MTATGRRSATEPTHRDVREDEHPDPHPRLHHSLAHGFDAMAAPAIVQRSKAGIGPPAEEHAEIAEGEHAEAHICRVRQRTTPPHGSESNTHACKCQHERNSGKWLAQ